MSKFPHSKRKMCVWASIENSAKFVLKMYLKKRYKGIQNKKERGLYLSFPDPLQLKRIGERVLIEPCIREANEYPLILLGITALNVMADLRNTQSLRPSMPMR